MALLVKPFVTCIGVCGKAQMVLSNSMENTRGELRDPFSTRMI